MKKILLAVLLALPSMAMADTLSKASAHWYGGYMVNETGLTHSATFSLSLPLYDGQKLSAEVVYTSATYSASTFTDGSQSTGNITVLSTTALSGVTLTIGGVTITAGTGYLVGASVNATAANLAQGINASTCAISGMLSAQAIGAVVYTTSTLIGGNFAMASSNAAKLLVSGANMTGGVGAYYSAATDIITVPAHKFTLGLPVLYVQGAAIGGLTTQTTYYVIPIDANNIYLSSTNALAITVPVSTNTHNDITTQRAQTTANTYTLTPLAISGTPGFYWQGSNDGTNFFNINISSVSMTSYTLGGATVGFDFDNYNFTQLFLNVAGPTTGGIYLKANVAIKQ